VVEERAPAAAGHATDLVDGHRVNSVSLGDIEGSE